MKSFAADYTKNVIPAGVELPKKPAAGEIFHLIGDMPLPTHVNHEWFCNGLYLYDGGSWIKITDNRVQRKASPIGSAMYENEACCPSNAKPPHNGGFSIADASIKTSHRRATISGMASLWVDLNVPGHVFVAVFRDAQLLSLVSQFVNPGYPQSMSVTFMDCPGSIMLNTYKLRVYSDMKCNLFVNQGKKMTFDGYAQTAFIVEQNV